jgi:hypothetical protein
VTEDRKGKSLIEGLPVRVNSTLAALHFFTRALRVVNRGASPSGYACSVTRSQNWPCWLTLAILLPRRLSQ